MTNKSKKITLNFVFNYYYYVFIQQQIEVSLKYDFGLGTFSLEVVFYIIIKYGTVFNKVNVHSSGGLDVPQRLLCVFFWAFNSLYQWADKIRWNTLFLYFSASLVSQCYWWLIYQISLQKIQSSVYHHHQSSCYFRFSISIHIVIEHNKPSSFNLHSFFGSYQLQHNCLHCCFQNLCRITPLVLPTNSRIRIWCWSNGRTISSYAAITQHIASTRILLSNYTTSFL